MSLTLDVLCILVFIFIRHYSGNTLNRIDVAGRLIFDRGDGDEYPVNITDSVTPGRRTATESVKVLFDKFSCHDYPK